MGFLDFKLILIIFLIIIIFFLYKEVGKIRDNVSFLLNNNNVDKINQTYKLSDLDIPDKYTENMTESMDNINKKNDKYVNPIEHIFNNLINEKTNISTQNPFDIVDSIFNNHRQIKIIKIPLNNIIDHKIFTDNKIFPFPNNNDDPQKIIKYLPKDITITDIVHPSNEPSTNNIFDTDSDEMLFKDLDKSLLTNIDDLLTNIDDIEANISEEKNENNIIKEKNEDNIINENIENNIINENNYDNENNDDNDDNDDNDEICSHLEVYSNDSNQVEIINQTSSLKNDKINNKISKDDEYKKNLLKYKLPELQDIAIEYNIELNKNNKKKNKIELINDIKIKLIKK